MRWRGGQRSGNIDDRRGLGPTGAVGGIGIVGIIVALVGIFVFDVDPGQMLSIVGQGAPQALGNPDSPSGLRCQAGGG